MISRVRVVQCVWLLVFAVVAATSAAAQHESQRDDCQICKDLLQVKRAQCFPPSFLFISRVAQFASDELLLSNSTIDRLDKQLLHLAIKTGLCGPKGRIGAVDVCEGALNEYGPLVAEIVDTSPIRTLAETDLCSLLRFCPVSSHSAASPPQTLAAPRQRRFPSRGTSKQRPVLSESSVVTRDVGYFTVITDVHWDPFYTVGSVTNCDHPMCCRANYGPRAGEIQAHQAAKWGDYACDPPLNIVNATFAFASSLPADFVLFTGDAPPHDVWNQSAAYNMDTLDTLMNLLKLHFPSTPVFPSVGNHDTFPCDQFSINQTEIYQSIASTWCRFLPPPALETAAQGAFYSTLVLPGLRAIALNSMWQVLHYLHPFHLHLIHF